MRLPWGSSPHTRGAQRHAGLVQVVGRIIPAYAGSTVVLNQITQVGGDHPRIRGEHPVCTTPTCAKPGSSPHTRGALGACSASILVRRIIPAYAGSTSSPLCMKCASPDHPRIRGEHSLLSHKFNPQIGSSPHTRGAQPPGASGGVDAGIIPAYAGSTTSGRVWRCRRRDHPRIRGEHQSEEGKGRGRSGSSPHTRGAPSVISPARYVSRIIPAYAGSTDRLAKAMANHRDHPRIRGEHDSGRRHGRGRGGSSPHTRGARKRRMSHPLGSPDHPRIRGEHLRQQRLPRLGGGSSPHTRGARRRRHSPGEPEWIIPAYAGSTGRTPTASCAPTDHPRIRGEHAAVEGACVLVSGSSPHTRGAPPSCR